MNAVRPSLACVVMVLCCASTSSGQSFEVGATIATSCKGSDGSFCNDTHSGLRTTGPYASVWFNDFIEVSGRVAWLDQPDISGTPGFGVPSRFSISDRERTIGQAEIIWHFLRGERVRLMFGLGIGRYWDRELVTCEPAGCEPSLTTSGLTPGRIRESQIDRSILVGLSAPLGSRLRFRGGWRYHNPLNDEHALSEVFVGLGYRFAR